MIDYFLQFADRNAAKNDPLISKHYDELEDLFAAGNVLLPKFWRHSQDVLGTDEDGNEIRTHNYLSGFFILISLPEVVPALVNHSAVQLVVDREKVANKDWSGIIKKTPTNAVLKDLRWSPVFAGAEYHWGEF